MFVWSVSKSIIWPPACLRGKARSVFSETGPLWTTVEVEWYEAYKVYIITLVQSPAHDMQTHMYLSWPQIQNWFPRIINSLPTFSQTMATN